MVTSTPTLWTEVAAALNIVLPAALANSCEYLPVCLGFVFVGHGKSPNADLELDAVGLARTYFNMIGMAPGFGLISALRTQCPQAVGAGMPKKCAGYIQRTAIIVAISSVFMLPLVLFAGSILEALGQPPELCALAQPYVIRMSPQYYFVVGLSILQRVFQAHGWNYANLVIVGVACLIAPLIQWFLIRELGLGYLGAAFAGIAYNFAIICIQIPYLYWLGHGYLFELQWHELTLRDFLSDCKLITQGFTMVCVEWWVMEVIVLFSGRMHNSVAAVGASAVASQVQTLAVMAWIGLCVAASTQVGQRIGAGDAMGARRAAKVCLGLGVLTGLAIGMMVEIFAPAIADAFAKPGSINRLMCQVLRLLAPIMVLDATNNTLVGVCSGLGLLRAPACGQLAGYYGVCLPFAVLFGFVIMGSNDSAVFMLWTGVGLAMLTASIIQVLAIMRHDWQLSVAEARMRLGCAAAPDAEQHGPRTGAELGNQLLES